MAARHVGPILVRLTVTGNGYPVWYNADDIRLVFRRPNGTWVVRIAEPRVDGRVADHEVPEAEAQEILRRFT